MFGELSLSFGGNIINERSRRSEKTWLFLAYLVQNMDREITLDELCGVLWENESIENPKNAMKTLLHRLRTELAKLGMPPNEPVVINHRDLYMFNKSINFTLDTLEFSKTVSNADSFASAARLVELYKGEFLSSFGSSSWLLPLRERYRSAFTDTLRRIINPLLNEKQYQDIIMLCSRGILSDPANEFLNSALNNALTLDEAARCGRHEAHDLNDVLSKLAHD